MPDWEQFVRERASWPSLSPDRERRIVRELAAQLEDCFTDGRAAGLSPADAEARARGQIADWSGFAAAIGQANRPFRQTPLDRWSAHAEERAGGKTMVLVDLWADVLQSLRFLLSKPVSTLVAVATLAVGIGANATLFALVDTVVLRPSPYPFNTERVLLLDETSRLSGGEPIGVAYPNYRDWTAQSRSFETMAGYRDVVLTVTGEGGATRLAGRAASAAYFSILEVKPLLGRFYSRSEDSAGGSPVVVLNHALWQNRFAADPRVVGRRLVLDDRPYTIVGVLPADFELVPGERAYLPLEPQIARSESARSRGNHQNLQVVARLKRGVTLEQARSEMTAISERLARQYPATNSSIGVFAERLNAYRTRDYRAIVFTLQAAVGFVLLIACVNVANLLLVGAVSRRKDVSIRMALGAGRARIVRRMLTEGVMLSLLGGAAGLAAAVACLAALRGFLPPDMPGLARAAVGWRVFGVSMACCAATGVLFGLVPAVHAFPSRLGEALRQGGRDSSAAMGRGRLDRVLLVAEVALATVLVIGAGLLVRTVRELSKVDLGFPRDHLVLLTAKAPDSRYPTARCASLYREVRDAIRTVPGVTSVSFGLSLPVTGSMWGSIFIVGDRPVPPREALPFSAFNPVDAGYFQTLGIRLLAGRLLNEFDTATSANVVVVNEAFARHFWPNESAIGKRIKQGWPESPTPWREIVGVVGNVTEETLGERTGMMTYMPFVQSVQQSTAAFAMRTSVEPATVAQAVRTRVRAIDADLPVYGVTTMDREVSALVAPRRVAMAILLAFAAVALALSAIGIYGVIGSVVARRTREMGVRLAIGARPLDVFRMVVWQGMALAAGGLVLGLGTAFFLAKGLAGLLYGVGTADSTVLICTPLILGGVALVACAIPARRTMRVDPVTALRSE